MMRTSGSNGKRSIHGLDLVGLHETRVCHSTDIDALALRQEACNILGTEAVSDSADLLDAEVGLHLLDNSLDDRVDLLEGVTLGGTAGGEPRHDVETLRTVEQDWVTLEEIRHDDKVACSSGLVSTSAFIYTVHVLGVSPLAANWSAMSCALLNSCPITSVRTRMASSVCLLSG